jgi:hypothetical protein
MKISWQGLLPIMLDIGLWGFNLWLIELVSNLIIF